MNIETKQYISILRNLVEEGKEVTLLISGSSMSPFLIHHRDRILFSAPHRTLRKGDMVFYQRSTGQYVMHRIYKVQKDRYEMIGDAQTQIERGVSRSQIFGLVTKVQRKGQWMDERSFWWKFFAVCWIRIIPLRPFFIKSMRFISVVTKTFRKSNLEKSRH